MAAKRVGAGNFAENPERAAEAGRKGGQLIGENFTIALSEPVKRASKEVW
ncbi:general stress protein [Pantoea sp. S62]